VQFYSSEYLQCADIVVFRHEFIIIIIVTLTIDVHIIAICIAQFCIYVVILLIFDQRFFDADTLNVTRKIGLIINT